MERSKQKARKINNKQLEKTKQTAGKINKKTRKINYKQLERLITNRQKDQ